MTRSPEALAKERSGALEEERWQALIRKRISSDDFEKYFPNAPLRAVCIKECARLSVLRRYDCPDPILDVGCGDGLFTSIALPGREVWGIDIDAKEGRWAQASKAYSQIILGDVTRTKLPARFFRDCVANCSLEHVPNIDGALTTIQGALAEGGRAYLFVPHRDWASRMTSVRLLSAIGARRAPGAGCRPVDGATIAAAPYYDGQA